MSTATQRRTRSHGTEAVQNPESSVSRDVARERDLAHAATGVLLETFWRFAQSQFAGVAAMMISTVGQQECQPVVNGELKALLADAAELQKAHGRNIAPTTVAADLDIAIPSGYLPTFDLYLRAIGIRPDTNEDRAIGRTILGAVKRKIREVRKLNDSTA